jgi:hypothetical protein
MLNENVFRRQEREGKYINNVLSITIAGGTGTLCGRVTEGEQQERQERHRGEAGKQYRQR